MSLLLPALVSLAFVALYAWQDWPTPLRPNDCADGDRYVSGKRQPDPFHRRFCGWNKAVLIVTSLASMVAIGALMPGWKGAAILMSLPGAWFICSSPTTVDAPAMLLALGSGILFKEHPWVALAMSLGAGFIHERAPVFAALYAWHPLPLVGLVMMGWWREPARPDNDELVGRGFVWAVKAHKPYNDFLDSRVSLFSLRGVPLFAAYYGVSWHAWVTLAIAWGSRVMGTDFARYIFWAAPVVVRELPPDIPAWLVGVHLLTFRRCI